MPTATGTPSAARASSSPPCPPIARTACWRSASTSQGGSPQGYSWHQPWKICGFTPDGTIKPAWAARLDKVIKACDRLGMAVILGLFYGKQSGTLKDEAAVKAAVTNTVDWLLQQNATNVLLEIGNEVDLPNVFAIRSSRPSAATS